MKALQLVKRTARAAVNLVTEAEAELMARRAEVETARAEAHELGAAWLHAGSQTEAEEIARRRMELLRVGERGEKQIPDLELRLLAAKAEKQRHALARHREIMAGLLPKLKHALELAAAVQSEVIRAREQAITEIGESLCAVHLPHLYYRGFVTEDLIELWAVEQARIWTDPEPKPQPSVPKPVATPRQVNGVPTAHAAPPPVRSRRQDPVPAEGQAAVVFLRPGAELPDGIAARIGDRCNLPVEQARALVNTGAADYAPVETQ